MKSFRVFYFLIAFKSFLVFSFIITTFKVVRVDSYFFVILLKSSQVFTSFGEFSFFHTFSDVPVNESTLGVHKIKLMIKTSPSFSDSSGVGQHANGTLDLGKITSWDNSWGLVVDTDLETSWTPVNKLDRSLGFDGGNSGVDILRDNITSVQETTSHVLSVSWIAFNHLVGWFEASVGDFSDRQLFMVSLFG